jgi:hypothetical protein
VIATIKISSVTFLNLARSFNLNVTAGSLVPCLNSCLAELMVVWLDYKKGDSYHKELEKPEDKRKYVSAASVGSEPAFSNSAICLALSTPC